jgi:hypothetical protein
MDELTDTLRVVGVDGRVEAQIFSAAGLWYTRLTLSMSTIQKSCSTASAI